jgi:glyoxylase-like metal-dependent hydrolase (beta-lactamase superfamily II)
MAMLSLLPLPVGPLQANAYLVSDPAARVAALVDPGAEPDRLLAAIDASGCRLVALIATHGHFDHVGAAAEVQARLDLPLLIHPDDAPLVAQMPEHQAMFGFPATAVPRVATELAEGATIAVGGVSLAVRHAPGHSPGHVILTWPGHAIVGDVIFAGSVGRTDLPGGSFAQLERSIRRVVYPLPAATRLHPGHGPATTVGEEAAHNPFVRPAE